MYQFFVKGRRHSWYTTIYNKGINARDRCCLSQSPHLMKRLTCVVVYSLLNKGPFWKTNKKKKNETMINNPFTSHILNEVTSINVVDWCQNTQNNSVQTGPWCIYCSTWLPWKQNNIRRNWSDEPVMNSRVWQKHAQKKTGPCPSKCFLLFVFFWVSERTRTIFSKFSLYVRSFAGKMTKDMTHHRFSELAWTQGHLPLANILCLWRDLLGSTTMVLAHCHIFKIQHSHMDKIKIWWDFVKKV